MKEEWISLSEETKKEVVDISQDVSSEILETMMTSKFIENVETNKMKIVIMITALLRSVLAITMASISSDQHDDFFDSMAEFLKHVARERVETKEKIVFRTKAKEFNFL